MLYDIIFVAVVVLIIAGFWWTRGVKGASPFDSAERRVDAMSRTSMTGEPIPPFDDEFKAPH